MNDLNWKFGLQVLVHLLINSDKDMNLHLIAGDVDVDRDGARDVTRDESENMAVDENMSQDRNDSQSGEFMCYNEFQPCFDENTHAFTN